MGTNLGGIPQEYFDAKKVSNEQTTAMQAKTIDTMPVNKPAPATNSSSDIPSTNKQNVDQMNTGNAADLQKDITLPNFKNISPSSFFELKREFLSLSESYIANFIKELNDMKAEYAIERKTDDLATFKKVDNSISSEQYSYYGYIFDRTNCVYLERITSVVMESKEYLDLFYFQVHFTYNVLRKSGQTIESDDIEKQEKGKKHKKIARLIQDLQMNESFTKLSPKDQESLKKVFTDKILF